MGLSAIQILKDIDVNDFLAHPSGLSKLMGGYSDHLITEKELLQLKELSDKREGKILHKTTSKPLKISDNDTIKLNDLIEKRDNPKPILSVGAKTECRRWLGNKVFKDRLEVNTDPILKGKETESAGILLASNVLGVFLNYNDKRESNNFMTLEIDVEFDDTILDNKSSYSSDTFPCWDFEEDVKTEYWWQGQGYMGFKKKSNYILSYTLVNAPESLIEKLAWRRCNSTGEEYDEAYEVIESKMTYDNIPEELRIKMYRFKFDEEAFSFIEPVVGMCRIHIQEMIDKRIEYLENNTTLK